MEKSKTSEPTLWERHLQPRFASVPELASRMERTIGEALIPPDAKKALAAAVPPGEISNQQAQASAWLAKVFRPEQLDEEAAVELLGVRAAVGGQDAFFGGWSIERRSVEVVVTRERVHVITTFPAPISGEAAQIAAAKALMLEFFAVSPEQIEGVWDVRPMGALVFATPKIDFATRWDQTCLIVTDGAAVKFSFLKIADRTSPPKGSAAAPDSTPWFPPPEEPAPTGG